MGIRIGSSQELNFGVEIVTAFYEQNWLRKIALSNADFYNWQFIDTPINKGDQCCIAVLDDEIVAVMGLNERRFSFENKELDGAELTTWIVKEDKRNLGLGPKMLDYLQSKYSVLVGMGISSQALPIYLRKGFKYKKEIPRFIKVLNEKSVKIFGSSTPLLTKLNRNKKTSNYFHAEFATKEIVDNIFSDYAKYNNLFFRDFDWLTWRYSKHPSFNYVTKVIANNNGNKSIVVYRIDRLEGLTIMHCVDFFGDYRSYPAALSYLESEADKESVDIIDFYSTNTKTNAYFIGHNWFPVLDCDFINFPHLFHPIEMREPSTTSMIIWNKESEFLFYDIGSLYISKQDCDFDRPTAINI